MNKAQEKICENPYCIERALALRLRAEKCTKKHRGIKLAKVRFKVLDEATGAMGMFSIVDQQFHPCTVSLEECECSHWCYFVTDLKIHTRRNIAGGN